MRVELEPSRRAASGWCWADIRICTVVSESLGLVEVKVNSEVYIEISHDARHCPVLRDISALPQCSIWIDYILMSRRDKVACFAPSRSERC